ncbi:MAG: hypothetical protein ACJATA_000058 [Sphingobacteriales bacterium]|jgi:hypothetical protein
MSLPDFKRAFPYGEAFFLPFFLEFTYNSIFYTPFKKLILAFLRNLTRMTKLIIFCTAAFMLAGSLSLIAQAPASSLVSAFKDTRVINGHSVETTGQGTMKFVIGHRFGSIKGGVNEFFGLDQATTRLGLDFGLTPKLDIGIGRSGFEKVVDVFGKYAVLQQTFDNSTPLSLSVYVNSSVKTQPFLPGKEAELINKVYYNTQIILAKMFSPAFSMQLMPMYSHRNYSPQIGLSNEIATIGVSSSIQVSRLVALVGEYYYTPESMRPTGVLNTLSLGVDLGTAAHVFQLHVSNGAGMIERQYISTTRGEWLKGDIMFGFNISRDFRIAGRKYK